MICVLFACDFVFTSDFCMWFCCDFKEQQQFRGSPHRNFSNGLSGNLKRKTLACTQKNFWWQHDTRIQGVDKNPPWAESPADQTRRINCMLDVRVVNNEEEKFYPAPEFYPALDATEWFRLTMGKSLIFLWYQRKISDLPIVRRNHSVASSAG